MKGREWVEDDFDISDLDSYINDDASNETMKVKRYL